MRSAAGGWSSTRAETMKPPKFDYTWQYVDHWGAERPEAEAAVFGEERWSWRDMQAQTASAARALVAAGVNRGDRVAMLSMGRPTFLSTFMGANRMGACWLGMSPKFTAAELRYMIDDCQPKVLFTLSKYYDVDVAALIREADVANSSIEHIVALDEPFDGAIAMEDFLASGADVTDAELDARTANASRDDDVLLMYTSGSTGKPKGVLHTHRSVIANVITHCEGFDIDEAARCLLHFPINHVAADVEIGFATIYLGGAVVILDRFDPLETLQTVEKERVTFFGQVPAMYLMQGGLPEFRTTDWSSVDAFVWGGAPAPKELLQGLSMIAQQIKARLITGYGATETGGFVTFTRPGDELDHLCSSAGYCPAPFEMKIVDDDGATVAPGVTGEVCIRGETIMKGYLNKPEATAAVLDSDGWYHTSDLGHVNENGDLFLCGRKSEMFKSGGENVFPREVEDAIESHPNVVFSAVIGVPDPMFQEVGHAFVMPKPGAEVTPEELKQVCKDALANFKVPKTFEIRPMLPLLPNGKVNKMALKSELSERAPI